MTSLDRHRSTLVERLRARKADVVARVLARVREVADPVGDPDPELAEGVRATLAGAIEYTLEAIARGRAWTGGVPLAALQGVRRAARGGVALNTVLRRYLAGNAALWDVVIEEADGVECAQGERTALLRQAAALQNSFMDHLISAIADEYLAEVERGRHDRGRHEADLVVKLLAGEIADARALAYDLDTWHLGAIAAGPDAESVMERYADALGSRLLTVPRDERTLWCWLGRRELEPGDLERLSGVEAGETLVGIGEPAHGLDGFRASHRQARAAYRVARLRPGQLVRYSDVALLALGLEDDDVATTLVATFLAPLDDRKGRGEVLRETLRAYFATGQNATSAAALLGVHERTVSYRIRTVEDLLGHHVNQRRAELETALELERLLEERAR